MIDSAGVFSSEALQANRDGRLTPAQTDDWGRVAASRRNGLRFVALLAAGFGALFLVIGGPASKAWQREMVGAGLMLFAVVVLVAGKDGVAADVAAGRIQSVEGILTKVTERSSGRGHATSYFLDVAGTRLKISHDRYEATPDAGYVRAFYFPKSKFVVNLERLSDRALALPVPISSAEPQNLKI
ncbi:MAG TPA: hypothetical protein VHZ73_05180 [Vicinamibacterales bacterium]|nr:hypothetical protein [Vicinamibacterales bacterium]